MTAEVLFQAFGEIDARYVTEAREPVKKAHRRAWGAAAACLALIVGAVALRGGVWRASSRQTNAIKLSDASHGVTAHYAWRQDEQEEALSVSSSADLIYLTEDELFTHRDTVIFKGTVALIDNIVLDFSEGVPLAEKAFYKDYRAIADIRIEKIYRGAGPFDPALSENSLREGVETFFRVLLPCPIGDGEMWVEDTDVISRLRVGMTGVFMAQVYDESSLEIHYYYPKGLEPTLCLRDLAPLGLPDGQRYAFLETEDGLVFDRGAYPSLAGAETLTDVEAFLAKRLGEQAE